MDFRIRRRESELVSTGYIEIAPGKYAGEHWQDGSLFIAEDAFTLAEGIVAKHVLDYDHLNVNDIPRSVGRAVTAEWREVAGRLGNVDVEELRRNLNLTATYREFLGTELLQYRPEIANMLRELADACDHSYEREEWICILGV